MLTEIAAVASSLKAAGDITRAAIELRDAEAMREKIIALQSVILSAQGSAIAANNEQSSLSERIRELENRIAEFQDWDREKAKYALTDVNPGRGVVAVYKLKPEGEATEPPHCLCPRCYEDRLKSILQSTPELRMRLRVHICSRCKAEYCFSYQPQTDSTPRRAESDFNLYRDL